MEMRGLGAGGPRVAAVGFGAMPLSILGRPDEAQALRVLHAALDAGVTFLDTADVYSLDASDIGHSERLIAKVLADRPEDRDRILVGTKGGSTHPSERRWRPDGRPEHLRLACDASLRALGVERIDLYSLHSPDPRVPFEESLGALAELHQAGKIRWVGVCNVDARQIRVASKIVPLQVVQNMLSVYERSPLDSKPWRRGVLATCTRLGVGFVAHSPLGTWWSRGLVDHPMMRPLADEHGVSPHALALAWVLAQGPDVVPIPGTRRVEHVHDLVRATEIRLSREELGRIRRAAFPREA